MRYLLSTLPLNKLAQESIEFKLLRINSCYSGSSFLRNVPMRYLTIHTIIILLTVCKQVASADKYTRRRCMSCVGSGGTFCRGSSFFDNDSTCVHSGLTDGFFGGCSDHSFGSTKLNSRLDCLFKTNLSPLILLVLIGIPTLICVICHTQLSKASVTGDEEEHKIPIGTSSEHAVKEMISSGKVSHHHSKTPRHSISKHHSHGIGSASQFGGSIDNDPHTSSHGCSSGGGGGGGSSFGGGGGGGSSFGGGGGGGGCD